MATEPATEHFDILIIGSGQGGTVLAEHQAKDGQRVALIERSRLGGSCVNFGCTPSKTLLAAAHSAARARAACELGIDVEVQIDFPRVMRRVRDIRQQWRESSASVADLDLVEVVCAEGRFVAPRIVEAGGRRLTADRIVVDTGTRPTVPGIDGLAGTPYLTNESIFDIEQRPKVLAVLGGGYIGLELGQAMARLGSEVHIIESSSRILGNEADNVAEVLQEALEADGVVFHLGTDLERVRHDGGFELSLDDGTTIAADAFLVAAGRTANTDALDAEVAGLELDDDGYVVVDDQLRTSIDEVWAIGDCAGQPAFTHVSVEDAYRLEAQWRGEERDRSDRVLAYAAFTEPSLGRVGQSTPTKPGPDVEVARRDYDKVGRAIEWHRTRGFQELVFEQASGKILGATILGDMGAELAQLILPLIELGATRDDLTCPTFVHPTYMESLRGLARSLDKDD